MPRNTNVGIGFKTLMRTIVREELERVFSLDGDNDFGSDNAGTSTSGRSQINSRNARGRRGRSTKGRVTDPSDKRLKVNREL